MLPRYHPTSMYIALNDAVTGHTVGDWPKLTGELNTDITGGSQPMTAVL